MEIFKLAAKNLIESDLGRGDVYRYSKKHSSVSFFDGVWWIWSVVILIAIAVYNGWQLLKQVLVDTGWQNPVINKVLFTLLGIALVVAVIEKVKLYKKSKEENETKVHFQNERNKLIEACDKAAAQSGLNIYPWWRSFNGMDYKRRGHEPVVSFMKSFPNCKDEYGEYVCEFGEGELKYSGEKLLAKMNETNKDGTPKFKIFLSENIEAAKSYYVASIITFDARSAEKEYTEWVEDKDAERKMREYQTNLDYEERDRNMAWGDGYATNEELYLRGQKDYDRFVYDSMRRGKKLKNYESSLGHVESGVINEGLYYMFIDYHGYMVFDESMDNLVGLMIPEKDKCASYMLLTTSLQPGKNCRIEEVSRMDYSSPDVEAVLCSIASFPQTPQDFLISKPDNITDEEWGIWIYSHYADDTIFYDLI